MLQQHEVLCHIHMPTDVASVEVYGYCTAFQESLRDFVHVDEIFDLLQKEDALVITGGGHSTSLYRDDAGLLFVYDSMPACVVCVSSAADLTLTLTRMHRNMPEFTGTIVRRVPSMVSRL